MIVVDTNVIVYLYLPTEFTEQAEQLLEQEPVWAAPLLWRSEFRNVLALYLRRQLIAFDRALQLQTEAESLMSENEYEMGSFDVMKLVRDSRCSAYDCEFVALAIGLRTKLVTMDQAILREFPNTAISLTSFLS
ncbi:MAG: type II toxin-antitoxin system VapC family toxin [bacterium]|nr:type II toxin-antitoxin system VapC family toxin [bacterium]